MEVERTQLEGELAEANLLLENRPGWQRRWETLMAGGIQSAAEAESRILSSLREWSRTANMSISSIRPDRLTSDKGMQEILFTVSGSGNLQSVAHFLWQIETSPLAVKIRDMQLHSSSDAGESMRVELHLSALHLGPERSQAQRRAAEVSDGNI